MRKSIITLLFLFCTVQIFAQNDIEEYVVEGIQYHDNGNYKKAIESYKKALVLSPKSQLVNYEISLSYFSKGDYKKAIEHSDIVLKQKDKYLLEAYISKGSALDVLGETKASIKVFKKAIRKTGGHYLLYYNLGLTYYKLGELEKVEENLIKAIEDNERHASSHFMLAMLHEQMGNSIQSLLATHYFLFLEPNSSRSKIGYQMLQDNFGGNVTTDVNKPNTINITLSPSDDTQFGAVEMMVSMYAATRFLDENDGKTDDEIFVEHTELFFETLGELKEDKNKEIWWTFYTPFFYDLAKSDHLEAYCKKITQSENENSSKWLVENEDKVTDFENWVENK